MLLRRDPVASVADTDRAVEVAVIQALADEAVPAPELVAIDLDGAHLDRPSVVMVRAPGRADRAVLRTRDPHGLGDDGRLALAESLADRWDRRAFLERHRSRLGQDDRPLVAATRSRPGATT
jgi:aminoglycoside phosphotransferase (APT) family kinase protein